MVLTSTLCVCCKKKTKRVSLFSPTKQEGFDLKQVRSRHATQRRALRVSLQYRRVRSSGGARVRAGRNVAARHDTGQRHDQHDIRVRVERALT